MRFVATISEIHLGSIFYFYAFILGASSKSAEGIKSYESNVSIDICKRLRDYNIDLLLPSKSIFCHYPVSCKLKKHWEMIAYVFRKYPKNFAFQLFVILQWFTRKICNFLKKQPTFKQLILSFLFLNKTLRLNNLKTRTAMNAEISVFDICVEAIIYLLLYNLHDCTLKVAVMKALNKKCLWQHLGCAVRISSINPLSK